MGADRQLHLDPRDAFELVAAALDLVASVSPKVHARLQREYDRGGSSSDTLVSWTAIVKLRRALNQVSPGLADELITSVDRRSREAADERLARARANTSRGPG